MCLFYTFNLLYVVLSHDNELHFFGLGVKYLFIGLRHLSIVLRTVRVTSEYNGPVWSQLPIWSVVAAQAVKDHY